MAEFVRYDVTVSYTVVSPAEIAETVAQALPTIAQKNARWCAGQVGSVASTALVSMRLVPEQEPRG